MEHPLCFHVAGDCGQLLCAMPQIATKMGMYALRASDLVCGAVLCWRWWVTVRIACHTAASQQHVYMQLHDQSVMQACSGHVPAGHYSHILMVMVGKLAPAPEYCRAWQSGM
jgi:hypothetical protein